MGEMQAFELEAFRRAFDLQLLGQSQHPAMVRLRTDKARHLFVNRVEVMRHAGARSAQAPGRWNVRQVARFDARVDALWREASTAFAFAIVRRPDYLNWRYADKRAGEFVIHQVDEDGRLLGYAVLCARRNRAYIADLLVAPGRDDVLNALICDALEHFAAAGVRSVDCWTAKRHPYRAALEAQGFARKSGLRTLAWRPLGTAEHELLFLDAPDAIIHVMAGDTDRV
jgi:hypothetical protein